MQSGHVQIFLVIPYCSPNWILGRLPLGILESSSLNWNPISDLVLAPPPVGAKLRTPQAHAESSLKDAKAAEAKAASVGRRSAKRYYTAALRM